MTGQPDDNSDTQVFIEVTLRLEMPAAEVWPDGLPEVVDADAVIAAVEEAGSVSSFISDWDADLFGAEVEAQVDGRSARGWLR
jgi:hypothetical protein